jgi:hypothetical protein
VQGCQDPTADRLNGQHSGASVTVVLDDVRAQTATRPTRKGDPDDPLSDEELQAKFDELVGDVLGREPAAGLSAALWSLPTRPTVGDLPYARAAPASRCRTCVATRQAGAPRSAQRGALGCMTQ